VHLAPALSSAKSHMGDGIWTWAQCIEEAIASQKAFRRDHFTNPETLRCWWFAKYRDTGVFPHPHPKVVLANLHKAMPAYNKTQHKFKMIHAVSSTTYSTSIICNSCAQDHRNVPINGTRISRFCQFVGEILLCDKGVHCPSQMPIIVKPIVRSHLGANF
jgi:hypothetical protein